MKIILNTLIALLLLINLSSEAQNTEVKITEIKDSIIGENYSYKFSLPMILSNGEYSTEKLNTIIAKTIFPCSILRNNEYITDTISRGIKAFLNKEIVSVKDLITKKKINSNNYNLAYDTKFNSSGLLSFVFVSTEKQISNKKKYRSYLNIDAKIGKELNFDDIMVDTLSLPLLSKIELRFYKKVKKEIDSSTTTISMKESIRSFLIVNNEDNFPLCKSPKGYFCTNNKGDAGMCFLIETNNPKIFQSLNWFVNGYFFSFEELRPYLKEDFKKRIDLQ